MLSSDEHPLNEYSPIDETEEGIMNCFKLHPLNASFPIPFLFINKSKISLFPLSAAMHNGVLFI